MIVPMQPPPSFFAPHPANIVLKNPFIMLLFLVSVKIACQSRIISYIINKEAYVISL